MPPFGGRDRIVIAIDFGTTFSGVAYAYSGDSEQLEVISKWPGGGNSTRDKVPTEILYNETGSSVSRSGRNRQYQWGCGITFEDRKNAQPLKWFKLLLHDRNPFASSKTYGNHTERPARRSYFNSNGFATSAAEIVSLQTTFASLSIPTTQPRLSDELEGRVTINTPAAETAIQLARLGIKPVEVTTDYLRSLREHALSIIKLRYQSEFIRGTKVEYILTVPAVWSDSAKALTMQAASNAGFGEHDIDFTLIGEPEAAAAYSLHAIQPNKLNEGDTFVVCDAGGGTVDLVSYKIERLKPLSVSEAAKGSGGLCGSVFVNERFEEHVRELLGENTIDKMKPVAKREMMRQWEDKVKFKFGDDPNIKYYDVYIPGVADDEEKGLEGGILSLTRDTVKKIFDPIIERIIELVDNQIHNVRRKGENVSAILLVGGFGGSEYLRKRLSEYKFFGGKVDVMQPMNAWSAITRGALIQGLNGSFVKDQIARRHYGIEITVRYQEGRGWEKYRTWCDSEEVWEVPNQMRWVVNKGMLIEDQQTVSFPFYIVVNQSSSLVLRTELLACDIDNRPSWCNPESVYHVCIIPADLSSIPLEHFDEFVNSKGQRYWRIHYSLEMKITSGMFTFSVKFEGRTYGTKVHGFE